MSDALSNASSPAAFRLRLQRLPSRPGGDRARRAGGRERAGGDADGQRQVAVLPASGDRAAGPHAGGVAADRADARPGARLDGRRGRGGQPQFKQRAGRECPRARSAAPPRAAFALPRPRAVGAARHGRDAGRIARRLDGDRRGALRLAMGSRFPARVPRAGQHRAPDRRPPADPGADRDGRRADARRHRRQAVSRAAARVRAKLRPAQPPARLQAQGALGAPGAGLRARP